jgi:cytidylate kinase
MNKDLQKIIIAIDGHSSCGKSAAAKDIARILNLLYIDTGAMYRAVTLYAIQNNIIDNEVKKKKKLAEEIDRLDVQLKKNEATTEIETFLNGKNVEHEIRTLNISNNVSQISALGFVRKRLVELQREMGKRGGVILDGRDIGTVVFPNADIKLFMTATPAIRAQRRYAEMIENGEHVSFEEVLENIKTRDNNDSTRSESPLKKADDAIELDNSNISREEQMNIILGIIKEKGYII